MSLQPIHHHEPVGPIPGRRLKTTTANRWLSTPSRLRLTTPPSATSSRWSNEELGHVAFNQQPLRLRCQRSLPCCAAGFHEENEPLKGRPRRRWWQRRWRYGYGGWVEMGRIQGFCRRCRRQSRDLASFFSLFGGFLSLFLCLRCLIFKMFPFFPPGNILAPPAFCRFLVYLIKKEWIIPNIVKDYIWLKGDELFRNFPSEFWRRVAFNFSVQPNLLSGHFATISPSSHHSLLRFS